MSQYPTGKYSEDTEILQRELIEQGYLPPLNSKGEPSDDGWLGPATLKALREREQDLAEMPAPAKPWWRTKRGQGFVTLVVGSAALFIPALREVDTAYLIELIWDNLDHVDAIISAGGALITAGGAIWATIGAARAKAPIDPHLLLPGVRLPDRVRRSGRQAPAQSMSADSERRGYWGDPRGPFDPE